MPSSSEKSFRLLEKLVVFVTTSCQPNLEMVAFCGRGKRREP
jgi:hypothetical protein